jgi:hypothetical protein
VVTGATGTVGTSVMHALTQGPTIEQIVGLARGRPQPVESILDAFEDRHRDMRVVRLRPGLIFEGQAASDIRRLFVWPLLSSPRSGELLTGAGARSHGR